MSLQSLLQSELFLEFRNEQQNLHWNKFRKNFFDFRLRQHFKTDSIESLLPFDESGQTT